MEYALALSLLLLASVLWVEAHERRAVLGPVRSSSAVRIAVKAVGWVLAAVALLLVAQPQGWERGIPIWLAWFSLAGVAVLLFAGLYPAKHWLLGGAALVVTAIAAIVYFLGYSA